MALSGIASAAGSVGASPEAKAFSHIGALLDFYARRIPAAPAILAPGRPALLYGALGERIEDMVRSKWVYRKLRNFRAGIEAGISCLKRAYGLARCTWRGLGHFKAYVWSSVVAYNLVVFLRLRPS